MLEKEKQILQQHYEECEKLVHNHKIYKLYADEKIHHSLQVYGAGNYIMKHEPTFKNKSDEYVRLAHIAYLFHDIGRFQEIKELYSNEVTNNPFNSPYDHGVYGYKILQKIPEYSDLRIVLPIKHHGHLIEELYKDEEYQNITDPQLKKEVEEISFLVRDADKIANFQIIKKEDRIYKDLFFGTLPQDLKYSQITPEVLSVFENRCSIKLNKVSSMSDRVLCTIAWIFDMNYKPSFDFSLRLGGIDNLLDILAKFNPDTKTQEKIVKIVKDFILYKYQQFKE